MHNLTLILPSFVVIKDELKFSFRDFWSGLHSLLRPALPVLQNTTTATEDTSYVNGNKSKHRSTWPQIFLSIPCVLKILDILSKLIDF
jgi:hypothetical protein